MADITKLIFDSSVAYDKVRSSGEGTVTTSTGGSWVTLANLSSLGLTKSPKVYVVFNRAGNTAWRLPGGGTYFGGGRVPVIRVTSTAIQCQDYSGDTFNFKYWVLDTTMKAN